jgi:hypothetical protein
MIAECTSDSRAICSQPFAKSRRIIDGPRPSPPTGAQARMHVAQHAPTVLSVLTEMNGEKNQPDRFVEISIAGVKKSSPFGIEQFAIRISAVWMDVASFQYCGVVEPSQAGDHLSGERLPRSLVRYTDQGNFFFRECQQAAFQLLQSL